MGHFVQKSCKLWLDGFDFSGDINAIAINYDADEVEDTHFGDSTHIFLGGGLLKFDAQFEGGINLGTATVEGTNFGNVGVADTPLTIGLDTGAAGETGYHVNNNKSEMPKNLLDEASKDEQPEGVEQKVHYTNMEEHGGK